MSCSRSGVLITERRKNAPRLRSGVHQWYNIRIMDSINFLKERLSKFIELEGEKTREEIAGYIVGELIGDASERYEGLEEKYSNVARIADLASDLEWSNGSPSELESMWQEMRDLIKKLAATSR